MFIPKMYILQLLLPRSKSFKLPDPRNVKVLRYNELLCNSCKSVRLLALHQNICKIEVQNEIKTKMTTQQSVKQTSRKEGAQKKKHFLLTFKIFS